jgi:hypothetical protein
MESIVVPGPTNHKNDFAWSAFMIEVQFYVVASELNNIFQNFPRSGSPLWDIFWN